MNSNSNSNSNSFDLVVAGGSGTGVCAAVTAARRGLRVALIEYNAFFGGMATAALVPVWHSLYSTDGATQIIHGITEEIETRMLARGEARAMANRADPGVGCYLNVAALQYELDEIVREHPLITTFFKTQVVDVVKDSPTHITHVVIEDKAGRHTIAARFFIDATGDAILTQRAGFRTWRFEKKDLQAHTLCAIFANYDKIRAAHPNFSFGEVMKPAHKMGFKHVFGWDAPVIGAGEGPRFAAFTRISECDPSDPAELTSALFEGRVQLRKFADAVNTLFPMPEGERLVPIAIASDLGVRETVHIEAEYRVTADDVLSGRHFEDCAGRGSYRCDIHEGAGIVFRYLDGHEDRMDTTPEGQIVWTHGRWRDETPTNPTWYEFPLRALRPRGAENLLCAGRMIDCERDAYGALRVMVNCNQMGEAAAAAAAAAAKIGE